MTRIYGILAVTALAAPRGLLLRKEGNNIVCYQQLGRSPGVTACDPWKRECLTVQ